MFFRQNDRKTNCLFLHAPCYVCDVSWRKNDIFFDVCFFRQNDRKTNFLFLHTPCYVCDVSWRKNDIFFVFVFLDRMTERQIVSFYIRLATSVTYLGGRMTYFFVYFFRQKDRKTNCFFYMRLATSATYLGGRMTYFLVFVFLDRMTERQIVYFTYALLRLRRILAEE